MTLQPYYADDRCTIYLGDTLHVLADLDLPAGHGVDVLATDPPYSSGGQFRGDRTASTVSKYVNSETLAYRPEFSGDNRDSRSYLAWVSLWASAALRIANPGAVAALFTDWRQLPTTTDALQAGGWVWRGIAPWDKGTSRPLLGGFRNQCEFVVWGTNGPRDPGDDPRCHAGLFRQPIVRDRAHIAQKPVETMRWLLGTCPPGGLVLDPFIGSGTTLRAAADLGLRSLGIETKEEYCEIAAQRMQALSLDLGPVETPGIIPPGPDPAAMADTVAPSLFDQPEDPADACTPS